ncbi:bidirectional sugar transporter SWEET16 isoform X4 [Gossypium hirsutum]|uniref:Bidirectional sugar transporter SWEET n=2 Tax=Gossypium TaxID=3633 RepID=A0A1U8IDC0_GOSHI|nr:bidirectional sugar transporter SWEET16-like isoform X4 [Gossypium hirsutum]
MNSHLDLHIKPTQISLHSQLIPIVSFLQLLLRTSASMANLSFILGVIGNVISILLFASPIKTFWGVIKKKSTGDYKGEPYITTLLSTSLWTLYGIINPDGLLVMTVNGAGAILQLIYVILFLVYAPKDAKVKAAKLVCVVNVGVLGTVTAVTLFAVHKNTRLTFVGILCTALTIGMYASPLSAMVPNAVGLFLGSAQLILYVIYKNKPVSTNPSEAIEEEEEEEEGGSAHPARRGIEMNSSLGNV